MQNGRPVLQILSPAKRAIISEAMTAHILAHKHGARTTANKERIEQALNLLYNLYIVERGVSKAPPCTNTRYTPGRGELKQRTPSYCAHTSKLPRLL
jgi:hypothetical protein